jgi:serine protease Do
MNGRVVGINEAIYSPTGNYVGIGFAIPINTAKAIAADLIKNGKVSRPYLGIGYQSISGYDAPDRAQMGIDLKGDNGLVVARVYPGGPAAAAGIKEYDVLLEANRAPLSAATNLQDIMSKLKPGDRIVFKVYRNGSYLLLPVTLTQMPSDFGNTPADNQDQDQQPYQPRGQGQFPGFNIGP